MSESWFECLYKSRFTGITKINIPEFTAGISRRLKSQLEEIPQAIDFGLFNQHMVIVGEKYYWSY